MYWLLNLGHDLFKNWGLAIIFLTVLLKIATWPLSAAAYRSMGKMRVLAPRMKEIQDRHGDDKQKAGQAMMEFYKKEGVNPLGGCLPMLIQMPILLAVFRFFPSTFDLRQKSFVHSFDSKYQITAVSFNNKPTDGQTGLGFNSTTSRSVSYTHLTLPTKRIV